MIRVGPHGWNHPDWAGTVHPSPPPDTHHPLAATARLFDLAAVPASAPHAQPPKAVAGWCDLLDRLGAERFRFAVDLGPSALGADANAGAKESARLRAVCDLLKERGRLAAVIATVPESARHREPHLGRVKRLVEAWSGFPLALEAHHASWTCEEHHLWLKEAGVAVVNVDLAPGPERTEPGAWVTHSGLAVVRLHGRGSEAPEDHLYSAGELAPWTVRIGQISEHADEVLVLANNTPRGQAAVTALEIQAAVDPDRTVPVPAPLLETFPLLKKVPGLRKPEGGEFDVPAEEDGADGEDGQLEMF